MKVAFLYILYFFSFMTICSASTIESDIEIIEVAWGSKRSIEMVGEWKSPPTIVICKYAPVSEQQVRSAIDWWRKRGHRFGSVIPDSIHYGCIFGSQDGHIIIQLVSGEAYAEHYLARTTMRHNNLTGEMISAEIMLKGSPKERVLEHEIGHALGYLHYNRFEHLMHSDWSRGGWDDKWVNLNLR